MQSGPSGINGTLPSVIHHTGFICGQMDDKFGAFALAFAVYGDGTPVGYKIVGAKDRADFGMFSTPSVCSGSRGPCTR